MNVVDILKNLLSSEKWDFDMSEAGFLNKFFPPSQHTVLVQNVRLWRAVPPLLGIVCSTTREMKEMYAITRLMSCDIF